MLDDDVLAFHVPKFAQPSPEGIGELALRMPGGEGCYQTYPPDRPTLLRLSGERSREATCDNAGNEGSPFHYSIT